MDFPTFKAMWNLKHCNTLNLLCPFKIRSKIINGNLLLFSVDSFSLSLSKSFVWDFMHLIHKLCKNITKNEFQNFKNIFKNQIVLKRKNKLITLFGIWFFLSRKHEVSCSNTLKVQNSSLNHTIKVHFCYPLYQFKRLLWPGMKIWKKNPWPFHPNSFSNLSL